MSNKTNLPLKKVRGATLVLVKSPTRSKLVGLGLFF